MTTLVSIFTGTDEKLQLEAAWCLTNIATGSEEHALSILKHAGAYLVTYLSSGNGPLEVSTSVVATVLLSKYLSSGNGPLE